MPTFEITFANRISELGDFLQVRGLTWNFRWPNHARTRNCTNSFLVGSSTLPTSRLSMSRSLVSRFVLCFFLHRAFALVVALGFVALHRVSIRTLDELS